MYIMLFSFVVFRQLYLLIITHITDSIIAVSFGYPIGWLMCTTLLRLYYSYSGWERRVRNRNRIMRRWPTNKLKS